MVYLTGSLSRGIDGEIIDLVFVGNIDKVYLAELIEKAEARIHRRIRYIAYQPAEFSLEKITDGSTDPLLLWSR
jgi:hypothetical protein